MSDASAAPQARDHLAHEAVEYIERRKAGIEYNFTAAVDGAGHVVVDYAPELEGLDSQVRKFVERSNRQIILTEDFKFVLARSGKFLDVNSSETGGKSVSRVYLDRYRTKSSRCSEKIWRVVSRHITQNVSAQTKQVVEKFSNSFASLKGRFEELQLPMEKVSWSTTSFTPPDNTKPLEAISAKFDYSSKVYYARKSVKLLASVALDHAEILAGEMEYEDLDTATAVNLVECKDIFPLRDQIVALLQEAEEQEGSHKIDFSTAGCSVDGKDRRYRVILSRLTPEQVEKCIVILNALCL